MKIVHLSTTDYGGAYKAAERINEALCKCGADSTLYVRTKTREDTKCKELFHTKLEKVISKVKNVGNLLLSDGEIVSDYFGTDVSRYEEIYSADIVFLHWVNSFVSYEGVLKLISQDIPVICVLHDMWTLTGGCHLDGSCGKYRYTVDKNYCVDCPMMHRRVVNNGIPHWNILKKQKIYNRKNVYFVAISEWMKECALSSFVFHEKQNDIFMIHNPLDTSVFHPLPYAENQQKVILFGADRIFANKNKGYSIFLDALRHLSGEDYRAVCFGAVPEKEQIQLDNIDIEYLGTITSEHEMARLYSMADVFVAPSLQEAFGYTVCEALACGTPVVSFGVGGIRDQIIHMKNGYIAKLKDDKDLAMGIDYCARNKGNMIDDAAHMIESQNSYGYIGSEYLKRCLEIVGDR